MAEIEEELKRLLMSMKEESEKTGLKLNIQKTKIMAFGPITSWQIDREKVEAVTSFLFLGSKITVDGDCSHEIKRRLLLGRKAMTKLHSILKKQRYYFADKGLSSQNYGFLVKTMVFQNYGFLVKTIVVMYGCESWTLRKAEC